MSFNDNVLKDIGTARIVIDDYDDKNLYFDIDLGVFSYKNDSSAKTASISNGAACSVKSFRVTVYHGSSNKGYTTQESSQILHHVNSGTQTVTLKLEVVFSLWYNGVKQSSTITATDEDSEKVTISEPEEPDEPEVEKLSKFYWINSSTNISSGDHFSNRITGTKWNKLVKLLDSLLDTYNYKWATQDEKGNTLYSSIDSCYVDEDGGDLVTAKLFNSVRYNIGSHFGTEIPTTMPIEKGKTIYPEHFNGLQIGINKWINNYNNNYT